MTNYLLCKNKIKFKHGGKMERLTFRDLRKALMGLRSFIENDLQGKLNTIDASVEKQCDRIVFSCPLMFTDMIDNRLAIMTQWALKESFPSAIIGKQTIADVIKDGSISIGDFFVSIQQIIDEMSQHIKLVFSYGSSRSYN
jgi:hypothetical protein